MTTDTTQKPPATGLAKLREPFPANLISKLPKAACKPDEWRKLDKGKCKECGGWHATTKTIHLDYVGHAAITDRLLEADPAWTWEPMALDQHGLPALDESGGLWIRLTVCGVTRIGYGNATEKSFGDKGNREKELIGDALRNAAMRFGCALELWHKGDLHVDDDDGDEGSGTSKKAGKREPAKNGTTTNGAAPKSEYGNRVGVSVAPKDGEAPKPFATAQEAIDAFDRCGNANQLAALGERAKASKFAEGDVAKVREAWTRAKHELPAEGEG